ncbi:hypothetical protein LP419_35470 [Massilia sp. H-1]|nr:hypothetical protein LP419_35470 [Massilia sp. H-1]
MLREAQGRGSRHLHEAIAADDAIDVEGPFNSFPARGAAMPRRVGGGRHRRHAAGVDCARAGHSGRAMHVSLPGLHPRARRAAGRTAGDPGSGSGAACERGAGQAGQPERAAGRLGRRRSAVCLRPRILAGRPAPRCRRCLSWPAGAVQVESFGARSVGTDAPLTIHLAQSDLTLEAAPGATILDTLIDAQRVRRL